MIHLMIALQVAAADPASLDAKLQEIRAFVPISEQLATSGLMTYDQIEDLANAGFDLIINLAPTVAERNGREGDVVTDHAMSYVQIPVDWENPRQEDLDRFFDVMDENQGPDPARQQQSAAPGDVVDELGGGLFVPAIPGLTHRFGDPGLDVGLSD